MFFYVLLINCVFVAIAVLIHYEFLYRVTLFIPKIKVIHRYRIVIGVLAALIAHFFEIWFFAFAYYFMHHTDKWGTLIGSFSGTFMDCVYFSFTVFSTVGFGDIEPTGNIRYLAGVESVTGLMLITWSASFLYFEMQKQWDNESK